jgi:tetratricopeptide (TPR) repeat protein
MMKETWKSVGLGAILIVLLTLVAYVPAMRGGFIWDDDDYVTQNQTLRSVGGLGKIWTKPGATFQYYPLVFTSFWAEYHLWKLQPLGYHFVNVLLHALNAVLLWRVLRRLEIHAAWCAAAIFALHPVQVESVAWVTERKNVLSGMFYLLAMLAWFRFRPWIAGQTADSRNWRFYPLAMLLFLCALLSKTVTCSLPAAIVLLTWWKRGRVGRRDVLALIPLFVSGAALGLLTAWLEKHYVGAGSEWTLSAVQRCLLAGRALWFYVGKLFWPHPLAFIYPRWTIDAGVWWQYSFPLAALVVPITLWLLRRRIGRGPLVAVLCFGGTLLPALGFIDVYPFVYSFVADHFQYLACIGPIALVASAGAAVCRRAGQWGRYLGMLTVAAVLMMLGVSTWRQGLIYKDLETLWRDTLAKNPDAWMAHNNLGIVLAGQGRVSEAIAEYAAALRIKPDYADAHYNWGVAMANQGRVSEAMAEYAAALRIQPDHAEAHNNLGIVLAGQGRISEAIAEYAAAVRIKPEYAEAHHNLGIVLAGQGRISEAIAEYAAAVRIKPEYAEAHHNLGIVLAGQGRVSEAIAEYAAAVRIKPEFAEAHHNLGTVLAGQGRVSEAITEYRASLRIKPDNVEAHNNLGVALASQGKVAEAIAEFTAALRIKPDNVEAHNNLGVALASQGKVSEAIAEYAAALRIKPDYADAHYNLGVALAKQGRISEAVAEYRETLRIRPDYAEAQNKLARLRAVP